jgi:glycosyltransferase involved in cell wall biosynthesis
MKVCIVGASKRFTSGISYYTTCIANGFSEEHETSVITLRNIVPKFIYAGKKRVGKDITNLEFNENVQVFDGMDYNNPASWVKAALFMKKQNPDIIILQWWSASVAHMHLIAKTFARLCTDAKIIIEFHEVVDPYEDSILPLRLYSKYAGKLLRKNVDSYITHSTSDRKLVAERYAIAAEKIHVIPLGLFDHRGVSFNKEYAKQTLQIKESAHVYLSFGLIRKYKGIPYLIKAFNALPESVGQASRLLIVGEIWEEEELIKSLVRASPYRDHIRIINEYCTDTKVNLCFSAADTIVLPYTRSSQSGVASIAMNYGKPVIVSRVGGLKESMAKYEGTRFIPPENVEAIKNALLETFNNHENYSIPEDLTWKNITKNS